QTVKVRALILDRVVDAEVVVEIVVIERVREERSSVLRAGQRERSKEIDHAIVLTAQRQRAVFRRPQANVRLPSKQPAALAQRAVACIEAVLEPENRFEAAAEIFVATQSKAGGIDRTVGLLPGAMARLIVRIGNPLIDDPVQRNTALTI